MVLQTPLPVVAPQTPGLPGRSLPLAVCSLDPNPILSVQGIIYGFKEMDS